MPGVKPARQCAVMNIAVARPRDRAQNAVIDPGFELTADRVAAHEMADLEDHASLIDGALHCVGIVGAAGQGLLDEELLAGGASGFDQLAVQLGLGAGQ